MVRDQGAPGREGCEVSVRVGRMDDLTPVSLC